MADTKEEKKKKKETETERERKGVRLNLKPGLPSEETINL